MARPRRTEPAANAPNDPAPNGQAPDGSETDGRPGSARDPREHAREVTARLRKAGYVAYWAGGSVRDLLLGKVPKDIDVATNATPEQVRRLFRHTVRVGESFGVVRVLFGRGPEVEVATFRSDEGYSDGRRPDSVRFTTAEEDARRRDFTINGMFYDPESEEILDYVGGREDLAARVVRAIGDPMERFREDKLRLLRAVRFYATLDFRLDEPTASAARAMARELGVVSAERIKLELEKMLIAPGRVRALEKLRELDLLGGVFGSLGETLAAEPAWSRAIGALGCWGEEISFPLGLASVLAGLPDDTVTRAAEGLCLALRCSTAETRRVTWLTRHRRAFALGARAPLSTVKRLLANAGAAELLDHAEALERAEGGTGSLAAEVRALRRGLRAEEVNPAPFVRGHDLIALGLVPGPRFAALLEELRDAQLENRVANREEALELLKQSLSRELP